MINQVYVMEKTGIPINAFGGINKLHTRQPGQPSTGKNFYVRNGSLYTREGCSVLSGTPFTNPISSIHSAGKVQVTTRLLVEEGSKLWHTLDGVNWSAIKTDVAGNTYSSTVWSIPQGDAFLILVSGSQGLVYDIAAGMLSNLQNLDGDPPNFEFVTTWRGFVWGWAPNYPCSNQIRFCGYDKDERISIDYWPLDFAIVTSSDPAEPVLAAHDFNTHLFILTSRGYYRVYGYSEDNFEVGIGGEKGLYAVRCSAKVGEAVIWLGEDKKVYAYTGTSAYPISQPVDELLAQESFSYVRAYCFGDQFWLVFTNLTAGTTRAYVFDIQEKAWFIYEYPVAIRCSCLHGDYMSEGVPYFGLHDARILKIGGATDLGNPITTEFVLGPFYIDSRKFKAKRIWFNAEPQNNFILNVSTVCGQNDETEQGSVEFEAGGQTTKEVKLSGVKDRDISIKVSTTDRIDHLQAAEVVIVPRELK